MASVPPLGARGSAIVVRRTFIEEVDPPGASGGLGRQRSCSAPALFQAGGRRHPRLSEGGAACAATSSEVEFDHCGLSDAGTIETTLERLDDDDGASLPCYARLQEVDPAPGPGPPRIPAAAPAGDAEGPPGDPRGPSMFDHLLQENQRLAFENQMLREGHLLQANSSVLRDRLGACLAAQGGGGAPSVAVPPGAWVVPVGIVTVPRADARAEQPSGGHGRRCAAVQRALARRAGSPAAPPTAPESERTTVMMRNLPSYFSRKMLVDLLDREGFAGRFDFLYLPIDFQSSACLGYSFVNLVDPSVVTAFWSKFDGFADWVLPTKKVCRVCWTGPHQGLDAHIERYRDSPVMHPSVLDAHKPAVFQGGVMVPFPEPTKATRAPRIRNKPPGDPKAQPRRPAWA